MITTTINDGDNRNDSHDHDHDHYDDEDLLPVVYLSDLLPAKATF